MWTMRDVPKDLGQRILQAARLAAALHMRSAAQEKRHGGWFTESELNFSIGGAGPSASGDQCAVVSDASKDGHLPDHDARWAEGDLQ
jgi:hypothetical protein